MFKRGLSGVVASVLLIAIGIVAVGIVWVFVSAFLQSSAEKAEVASYMGSLSIVPNSVRLDRDSGVVEFAVQRDGAAGELSGLVVLVGDSDGNSFKIEPALSPPEELERSIVDVYYSEHGINDVQKIEIAPIIRTSKGHDFVGNILSSYNIKGNEPLPAEALEGIE